MRRREKNSHTARSTVEFLATPVPRPLDSIGQGPFVTLLGAGIQNPFGPTLNTLVVEGFFPFEPGAVVPFVQMMLNPFSQEATEVAIGRVGENWSPFEELPRFFSLEFGCCPTLLLPSRFFEHEVNVTMYAHFLASFEDGPAAGDAARDLSAELLKPERVKDELSQLIFFWEGSIRNLRAYGGHAMADSAMPVSKFAELLGMFAFTCRVPETRPLVSEVLALVNSQPGWS